MVEKPPTVIYASNPPQWDSVMWCACGHTENRGRVYGQTQEQMMREQWKRANTTMIYTHVLNRGGHGIVSPLDRMAA